MDQKDDCEQVLTQTQDLVEGDVFSVKSDGYDGQPSSVRPPAECSVAFNLGSRRLSVAVVEWTCEQPYREPVLAVYADCTVAQKRSKPLVSLLHHVLAFLYLLNCQGRPQTFKNGTHLRGLTRTRV